MSDSYTHSHQLKNIVKWIVIWIFLLMLSSPHHYGKRAQNRMRHHRLVNSLNIQSSRFDRTVVSQIENHGRSSIRRAQWDQKRPWKIQLFRSSFLSYLQFSGMSSWSWHKIFSIYRSYNHKIALKITDKRFAKTTCALVISRRTTFALKCPQSSNSCETPMWAQD